MRQFELFGPLRGSNGECRPSDPIAAAAAVVRIATGESDEDTETPRALKEAEIEQRAKRQEWRKIKSLMDR